VCAFSLEGEDKEADFKMTVLPYNDNGFGGVKGYSLAASDSPGLTCGN
jgi:hypothetical protein